MALPLEFSFDTQANGDAVGDLHIAKEQAKQLASDAKDRLAVAYSFSTVAVTSYWYETQKQYKDSWAPPKRFGPVRLASLERSAKRLAMQMGRWAALLDPISAGYLLGVNYGTMLPPDLRARLGVYYTPPPLSRRLIEMATRAGVDWSSCRVLDPACGGGAFLAPVAMAIAAGCKGQSPDQTIQSVSQRLLGYEIDPFGAWISQVFAEAALMDLCRAASRRLPPLVRLCDSVTVVAASEQERFDVVIGNPPYGRVKLAPEIRKTYQRSLFGHANLYGLFTDLAIQLAKRDGVIAFVTPTSFLAGEYFKSLRVLLATEAPPVNLDFVTARQGVFEDVLQETLLATYRRGGGDRRATVNFITAVGLDSLRVGGCGTFTLPSDKGRPWLIARTPDQQRLVGAMRRMGHRLSDYGYQVSTGPLVWNRHRKQLRDESDKDTVPLIWAESVTRDGSFVFRARKKNHQPYFRLNDGDEWLVLKQPCVLLQRTTAKEQHRRLIAAELPGSFLSRHGAVVVENHLNMIRAANGRPVVSPRVLVAFLNSEIADRAFRCISGSVAVSAYELEALPLPAPQQLHKVQWLLDHSAGREQIDLVCRRVYLEVPE